MTHSSASSPTPPTPTRRQRLARALRRDTRTIVVACSVAALVAVTPALAASVVKYAKTAGSAKTAKTAKNALAVNSITAVHATGSPTSRRNRLMAFDSTGLLPNNAIAKANDSDKLDGADSSAFVKPFHSVYLKADGTAAANGAHLIDTVAGITTATATAQWNVYLEPGTYDLGSASLALSSNINLVGAGVDATVVTSSGNTGNGSFHTIALASNSAVRYLTVKITDTLGANNSTRTALESNNVAAVVDHVRADSDGVVNIGGSSQRFGIDVTGPSVPTITDSSIETHNARFNAPVYFDSSGAAPLVLSRTSLLSQGGGDVYWAIESVGMGSAVVVVRDGTVTEVDGSAGALIHTNNVGNNVSFINDQISYSATVGGLGTATCLNSYDAASFTPSNTDCSFGP